MAKAMVSTVRPKASETPARPMPTSGNAAASTALPQPPNTSQKVPEHSAARRFDRGMIVLSLIVPGRPHDTTGRYTSGTKRMKRGTSTCSARAHRPSGRRAPGPESALGCEAVGHRHGPDRPARHQPAPGPVRWSLDRAALQRATAAGYASLFCGDRGHARVGPCAGPSRRRRSCSSCPSRRAPGTRGSRAGKVAAPAMISR